MYDSTDLQPNDFRSLIGSFFEHWQDLADQGGADGLGGAECRRVFREWVAANFPPLVPFVKDRANIGSGPTGLQAAVWNLRRRTDAK